MDSQITLRLPKELARALAKRAKAQGVPKSQLVREAVSRFMAEPERESDEAFWERNRHFIGCIEGDHEAAMADPVYEQMYKMNYRE